MSKKNLNIKVKKTFYLKTDFKNQNNTNILDLIKKTKLEQKKEKRQTVYLTAAAISALAISGFIISQ